MVVCSSVEIARRVLKVASARLDGGAGEHGAEVVREVAGEHSTQSAIEVVCSAAEVVRVLVRVLVRSSTWTAGQLFQRGRTLHAERLRWCKAPSSSHREMSRSRKVSPRSR